MSIFFNMAILLGLDLLGLEAYLGKWSGVAGFAAQPLVEAQGAGSGQGQFEAQTGGEVRVTSHGCCCSFSSCGTWFGQGG